MKEPKKDNFGRKLKSKFISFDQFGESVGFSINNDSVLRSCRGAIVSLVLSCLILYYTQEKAVILYTRGSTSHQQIVEQNEID